MNANFFNVDKVHFILTNCLPAVGKKNLCGHLAGNEKCVIDNRIRLADTRLHKQFIYYTKYIQLSFIKKTHQIL